MRKMYVLQVLLTMLLTSMAGAQVVVDGVIDQGYPPFRTINAAIGYALANSEMVVEIQTNTPEDTVILNDYDAPDGFTVRAGTGYTPVIDGAAGRAALIVNTKNTDRVNLEGLTFTGTGGETVLCIGALTLKNCTITNSGAASSACVYTGGNWGVAGAGLVIEGCQISGQAAGVDGVEFNTGIDSLQITSSTLEVTGNDAIAIRHRGLQGAPCPLTVSNSVVKASTGWAYLLAASDANVGAWTLTNCVFMINSTVQQPITVYWGVPTSITMQYCTWRASEGSVADNTILMRLTSDASVTVAKNISITNCLFDFPFSNMHSVVFTDDAGLTLSGDTNAYNIGSGKPYRAWLSGADQIMPQFEATAVYTATGMTDGQFVTDTGGDLTEDAAIAINHAIEIAGVSADINGKARPSAGGYDIGAFESDFTPVELSCFEMN